MHHCQQDSSTWFQRTPSQLDPWQWHRHWGGKKQPVDRTFEHLPANMMWIKCWFHIKMKTLTIHSIILRNDWLFSTIYSALSVKSFCFEFPLNLQKTLLSRSSIFFIYAMDLFFYSWFLSGVDGIIIQTFIVMPLLLEMFVYGFHEVPLPRLPFHLSSFPFWHNLFFSVKKNSHSKLMWRCQIRETMYCFFPLFFLHLICFVCFCASLEQKGGCWSG